MDIISYWPHVIAAGVVILIAIVACASFINPDCEANSVSDENIHAQRGN